MDLNKVCADLNFENSKIDTINANCKLDSITKLSTKKLSIDIKYRCLEEQEGKKVGKLLMSINVCIKDKEETPSEDNISVIAEGVFSTSSEIDDNKFVEMLNINGAAALYSIVRAKIEVLTGIIYPDGKLLLPMINMVQYYQERIAKKNELQ